MTTPPTQTETAPLAAIPPEVWAQIERVYTPAQIAAIRAWERRQQRRLQRQQEMARRQQVPT